MKANPRYKDIPIIFLTVKSEMDDIVKGTDLGTVDYITKPFNRRELISRVKTHMMFKQSMDELGHKNGEKSIMLLRKRMVNLNKLYWFREH